MVGKALKTSSECLPSRSRTAANNGSSNKPQLKRIMELNFLSLYFLTLNLSGVTSKNKTRLHIYPSHLYGMSRGSFFRSCPKDRTPRGCDRCLDSRHRQKSKTSQGRCQIRCRKIFLLPPFDIWPSNHPFVSKKGYVHIQHTSFVYV